MVNSQKCQPSVMAVVSLRLVAIPHDAQHLEKELWDVAHYGVGRIRDYVLDRKPFKGTLVSALFDDCRRRYVLGPGTGEDIHAPIWAD